MKDEANLTVHVGSGSQITTNVEPKSKLEVIIGDAAKMDCQKAINYIKSGAAEIEQAVQEGIEDFNDNAVSKTGDFNTNAVNKTNAFNQNAVNKTQDFDDNAAIKQAAVDASAAEAKQWAIGDPTEPDGYSSKYWANQAHSELSDLQTDVAAIQANYVTTNTNQTITADKTFGNPVTFNNTTTFNTGASNFYNGGYRMWKYKIASGSTYEDQSYYDSANTFLGSFRVTDAGRADFMSFISVSAPTPTDDNTTSRQIDTVGARNTKLANYVTTNTAQTISESKTFSKAIDGCFNIYGGYNTSTNTNQYKKLATCVISGTYQTRIIPFSYFRNSSNAKEPRFDGKLVARVAGTAGTIDTSNSFIVLGEYPNFVGNGAIDFIIAYKNNTPESNQVTVEFWVYVKNTYDGVAVQPFVSASGYSTVNNTQWTWGNPISEASEIPSDFSTIMSEKGTLNTVTQSTSDNSTKIATTAYVKNNLANYVTTNTAQTITNTKTFTSCPISQFASSNDAASYINGFVMKDTNLNISTLPSYNKVSYIAMKDSSDRNVGFTEYSYRTNGVSRTTITARTRNTDNNANVDCQLVLEAAKNGTVTITAPTPTDDNTTSKQIDTVGARNTKLGSMFQVVSALPATPDADTFYFIEES